jgi:predicted nucleic acid-binding protein
MIRSAGVAAAQVTVDVNVLVGAVVAGNDAFQSWPSPPPVRGNLAASVVGIVNDAHEFGLVVSEHILANVLLVLTGQPPAGYGWSVDRAKDYVVLLAEIAEASGGAVIEPDVVISECPGYEDNRILECAAASGSLLIVSDDTDLVSMSPWRGIPVLTAAQFVKRTDVMRRNATRGRSSRLLGRIRGRSSR